MGLAMPSFITAVALARGQVRLHWCTAVAFAFPALPEYDSFPVHDSLPCAYLIRVLELSLSGVFEVCSGVVSGTNQLKLS